jgi:hypothetical protein
MARELRRTAAHAKAARERSLAMKKKGKKDEAKAPKKGK